MIFDESGKGEIVEQIGKVFPNVGISVFAKTFVVESVNLRDLTRLVVTSEDSNALGESDLESDKERNSLYREVTTVDIIAYYIVISRRTS